MNRLLAPFTGYVPASDFAHRVVGPPASMLTAEQREAARLDPFSFRHVAGRGAHSSHERARTWVGMCGEQGVLRSVDPAVLVYRVAMGKLTSTGLIADVSLAAYASGLIKRHEATIRRTEQKMAAYMRQTRIYGNPVALAYREHAALGAAIAAHAEREPDFSFTTADGAIHALWLVSGDEAEALCRSFNETLYITDGHHRLAAAALVAAEEGRVDARLPAGVFAAGELRLRSFARYVVDPALDAAALIDRLGSEHTLEEVSELAARPRSRFDFGVKISDRSFRLRLDRDRVPDDPYESLDVKLLQDLVLSPILGISNPRRDLRLRFAPDLPDRSVEAEFDAWFLPYPTSITDVMAVADAGRTMPPKSTWFAPKLPSGLVIRMLDNDIAGQEAGSVAQ